MEDITIHQVLGAHNAVVLSDADLNLIFVWNGISCFLVFQEVGNSRFTLVDNWSTDVRPATVFEAQERCRYRLCVIRREHAAADAPPEAVASFPNVMVYCGLAWLANRLPAELASLELQEGPPLEPGSGIINQTRTKDPTAKVFHLDVMDLMDCVGIPGSSQPSRLEAGIVGASTIVFSGLRSCHRDVIVPAFKALSRCAQGAVVLVLP